MAQNRQQVKTALLFLTAGAPRDEAAATAGYSSVIDMRHALEHYLDITGWDAIEKQIMIERIDRLNLALWDKAIKDKDMGAIRQLTTLIRERRTILGYRGEVGSSNEEPEQKPNPQLALDLV